MLPNLPDWLSIPLLKLMMKVLPVHKVIDALGSMTEREIYSYMQPQIEKYSDKDLDRTIKDIKGGNYHGLKDFVVQLEKAGLTREIMLQWLENEKFLREHRRKYHRSEGEQAQIQQ
jgi:hypothetical protein